MTIATTVAVPLLDYAVADVCARVEGAGHALRMLAHRMVLLSDGIRVGKVYQLLSRCRMNSDYHSLVSRS